MGYRADVGSRGGEENRKWVECGVKKEGRRNLGRREGRTEGGVVVGAVQLRGTRASTPPLLCTYPTLQT